MYELAKNHNLLSSNNVRYETFGMYQSDGTILPKPLCDKLMGLAMEIIYAYKDEMEKYQGSLGQFVLSK